MNSSLSRFVTVLALAGAVTLTGCAPEGTEVTAPLIPNQVGGIDESHSREESSLPDEEQPSSPEEPSDHDQNTDEVPPAGNTPPGDNPPHVDNHPPAGNNKPPSGKDGVTRDDPEELGEIEGRQPIKDEKVTKLPASFPVSDVPLPGGAVIDDAGERSRGSWFVVIRYDSLDDAHASVSQIAQQGGLSVVSSDDSTDQLIQVLESDVARVEAFAYSSNGKVLLNLDVSTSRR